MIERSALSLPNGRRQHIHKDIISVDGRVRGNVNGYIDGQFKGIIRGNLNATVESKQKPPIPREESLGETEFKNHE